MLKSHNVTSPPARWTDAKIRAATPFPKPEGAIERARESVFAGAAQITLVERAMLRRIVEEADLIDAGDRTSNLPRFWLLVPAWQDLIDFLATFEVELGEDMGIDNDSEPGCDAEPDNDDEPGTDDELTADDEGGCPPLVVTAERRARYQAGIDYPPPHPKLGAFRLLKVYRADGDER